VLSRVTSLGLVPRPDTSWGKRLEAGRRHLKWSRGGITAGKMRIEGIGKFYYHYPSVAAVVSARAGEKANAMAAA